MTARLADDSPDHDAVTVICDGCGDTTTLFIHPTPDAREALATVRADMRESFRWTTTDDGDWCPTCRAWSALGRLEIR